MERQNEANLAGKVAIVTGSSRGIGKRAALALARRGARLERVVGTAIDRFDGVDILVNNAAVTVGYHWSAPLLEMPR